MCWWTRENAVKNQAFILIKIYLRETPIPLNEEPEAVEASVEMNLGLPVEIYTASTLPGDGLVGRIYRRRYRRPRMRLRLGSLMARNGTLMTNLPNSGSACRLQRERGIAFRGVAECLSSTGPNFGQPKLRRSLEIK